MHGISLSHICAITCLVASTVGFAQSPNQQGASTNLIRNPSGGYTHRTVEIPPGSRILYISGQTATGADGKTPADGDAQAEIVYERIAKSLADAGMTMQDLVNAAPKLLDYLGAESRAHFEGVQRYLDRNAIRYTINPRLVRGMDYYNRTVFEWITDQLGSQGTVCGGGRYDPLVEIFGGKPTPAVGFAMGVERLLELLKASGGAFERSQCDVYLVHQGEEAQMQAFTIGERIRDAGLDVVLHCATAGSVGSFKSQMKRADGSGAAFAVILGEDEVAQQQATVKHLRDADPVHNQHSVPLDQLVDYLIDQVTGDDEHDHGHLHAGQIHTH